MEMTQPKGPFCQSCGMPMQKPEDFGLNADGTNTEDYCHFCFQNGSFTEPDITLEQMINKVTGFLMSYLNMPEGQAQGIANTFIPTLKRWQ